MTIHYLNQQTKSDVSQEEVKEIVNQIKEGHDQVTLTDDKGEIYFYAKVSQILYID